MNFSPDILNLPATHPKLEIRGTRDPRLLFYSKFNYYWLVHDLQRTSRVFNTCLFFLILWNNKQFACSVFHLKYTNFIIIMFAPSCITLLDDYRGFFPGRAPGEDGKFLLDVSTIFRKCFHNIWKRPLI